MITWQRASTASTRHYGTSFSDRERPGHKLVTSPVNSESTHPVLTQHEARQAVVPPAWPAFRSSVRCDRMLEVWMRLAGGA
jgi:hypothetical protein